MSDTFTVPARDELIWLGVDLDGTLAVDVWPDPGIGEPIWANIDKLEEVVHDGYKVVIFTSRSWEMYETIEAWLDHHGIPWHRIVCGKLLVRAMIDDRAINAASRSWLPGDSDVAVLEARVRELADERDYLTKRLIEAGASSWLADRERDLRAKLAAAETRLAAERKSKPHMSDDAYFSDPRVQELGRLAAERLKAFEAERAKVERVEALLYEPLNHDVLRRALTGDDENE